MEKIAPGIWTDNDNELHLDVPELLEAHGYADTEANRNAVIRAAINVFDAVTVVQDKAPLTPDNPLFPFPTKES